MIPMHTAIYKTVSGVDIQADVYRTADDTIRPAILWLHGGALIFGDRGAIAPDQLETCVGAGYAVISVDYRLAPETKLKAIIDDLRDAYAWVRLSGPDRFRIDPERVAVIGHSAGGYLTLMAGYCVRPRPRALVSFYGYGDIAGPWYSRPDPHYCREAAVPSEEVYGAIASRALASVSFEDPRAEARWRFYLYCRQQGLWPLEVTGHDPDEERDWYGPFCPVRNVTEAYPPTLLIHGDQDTDVPFEQSVLMAEELARRGVDHKFVPLPGRGHGFDGEGLADTIVSGVFQEVLVFLHKHVKGHAA